PETRATVSAASSRRPPQARPLHLDVALEHGLADHPGAHRPAVSPDVLDGVEQAALAFRRHRNSRTGRRRRAGVGNSLRVASEPLQEGHEVALFIWLGWLAARRPQRDPASLAQAVVRLRRGDARDLVGGLIAGRIRVEEDAEVLHARRLELAHDELAATRGG